jgi:hypothetical protein
MPTVRLKLFIYILLGLSVRGFAQNYSVIGIVSDSLTKKGVPYASVALSKAADTSVVQFAVTKENGSFRMTGVKPGSYYLVVASVGYDVVHYEIDVNRDRSNVEVEVPPSTISFKEVMVRANKIPILFNGDTMVYNSSSFKTQTNATVEDLIKRMPGIQVQKDGSITTEGQTVTKVLINGKEFFGGNVEAATKNFDAALVDKLEVIDRKSDEDAFTGNETNEREKVINLVLKEDKAQGYFGTIRAGYGDNGYYDGHGNINFFRDETQLSIIGGLNNINRSLYGWQEMSTLNSFEIQPFNGRGNTMWWGGGVKTYMGGGANLHLTPTKGMNLDLAYVLSNENSVRENLQNSEVYLTEATLFSESNEESLGDQQNHQINAKMEYEPDSLNRIVFRSQLAKTDATGTMRNLTYNGFDLNSVLNSGVNKDYTENGNEKAIAKVHWTRKSRKNKENHFLGSVYYGYTASANDFESYFNTDTFLLPFPTNEAPLLTQRLRTQDNTIATTSAYQIQLSDKWTIRPGFNYMVSNYQHDFDWRENDGSLITDKSPVGNVRAQNLEYFMHISYKLDSFTTLYVVPEINQSIEDRTFTTDSTYNYRFNQAFFIPYMFLRSNKPHKYSFRFNIMANLNRPEVTQVLPVVDNSNPYRTNIGNIRLQNFMNYRNNWHYRRMLGLGKSIAIRGWNSLAVNPVINSNAITPENYAVSTVINYKNRIYSNTDLSFSWPLKAIKAQVEIETGYNYGQSYFIQNDKEIESLNHTVSFGPSLQFNQFDKWSLNLEYALNWQTGSIGGVANNAFGYQEIDAELIFTPIDRLEFANSLYMEMYGSNNAVGSAVIPILTSELSYFIDKNKQWSLGIRAYDIFDKNQNLWRWWSSNSFTQTQSNAVQRFVMGTVVYKIKKKSGAKGDDGPVDRRRH